MPPHVSDRWRDFLGPGALPSLAVAALLAVVGLGLPVLWRLSQVLRAARCDEQRPADVILVLGRTLEGDRPTPVFEARLAHGADLWRRGLAPRILVTGGLTGCSTRTEAEAGRQVLLAAGLPPEAILLEDRSRYTLENLFHAREILRSEGWMRALVVSDPLHLARARAFAAGLGLSTWTSPATAAAPSGPGWWLRAAKEACLLHWYHSGVLFSRLTGNRRYLARVT